MAKQLAGGPPVDSPTPVLSTADVLVPVDGFSIDVADVESAAAVVSDVPVELATETTSFTWQAWQAASDKASRARADPPWLCC